MTTLEAPITQCPVPWCQDSGVHAWSMEAGMEMERLHAREVLDVPTRFDKRVVVTAEVYETPTDTEPGIDVENADYLFNREQVKQLIRALTEAADLAFGPVSTVDSDEFDAALKEVVERAANPTDVNRLVAAAIRLREAYRELTEAGAA